jgi:hypothetical protein
VGYASLGGLTPKKRCQSNRPDYSSARSSWSGLLGKPMTMLPFPAVKKRGRQGRRVRDMVARLTRSLNETTPESPWAQYLGAPKTGFLIEYDPGQVAQRLNYVEYSLQTPWCTCSVLRGRWPKRSSRVRVQRRGCLIRPYNRVLVDKSCKATT